MIAKLGTIIDKRKETGRKKSVHSTLQAIDLQMVKTMHKSQNCASAQKVDYQGVLIAPKGGLHKYILSQAGDGGKLFAQTAERGVAESGTIELGRWLIGWARAAIKIVREQKIMKKQPWGRREAVRFTK